MKPLITGSASLLGRYLLKMAPVRPILTYHWNNPVPAIDMNITNSERVKEVLNLTKPDVVIHCAAEGAVDKAEKEHDLVKAVNVEGVRNLVQGCREIGAKFVFISTNAVFDGENPPYSENDERYAINKYGQFKIEAENEAVQAPEWMIIRPILLYGYPYKHSRGNFVTRILESEEIKVAQDIISQPIYAGDLAEKIWELITIKLGNFVRSEPDADVYESGRFPAYNKIYHIGSSTKLSLYEFALTIKDVFGLKKEVQGVPTVEFGCAFVDRPKNTCYSDTMIECPSVMEGLKRMRDEQ